MSPNTSARTWFKLAKQLKSKNVSTTIPTLIDDGVEATSNEDKTELNSFFSKQSTLDDSTHALPPTPPPPPHILATVIITPNDVIDAILLVNPSKACGPDLISPRIIT